jgi:chitinase
MEGIDPEFKNTVEKSTKELFTQMAEIILKEVKGKYPVYGKKLQVKVRTELDKLMPNLYNEWNNTRTEKYSNPVMENVASLPKDELGAMAESLVNLTKFKRRISREKETVGGPIDVAVITKGDGFVWMKRKHYFDAGLNPRFIARISKGRNL